MVHMRSGTVGGLRQKGSPCTATRRN